MKHRSRGYVPQSQWDDGIPAAFTDYSLSGGQARHQSGVTTSSYLSLRNGINLGRGGCATLRPEPQRRGRQPFSVAK